MSAKQTRLDGLEWATVILIVVLLSGLFVTHREDDQRHCVASVPVKAITSIHYRTATLLLNDQSTVEVDQATIKPGDLYCKEWSK